MFRIVRRRSREQLLIDMYEGLLRERERLVMTLASQANTPLPAAAPQARAISDLPDDITRELTGVMTDEEEELEAMKQAGVISQAEFDDALERMKRHRADDIIE